MNLYSIIWKQPFKIKSKTFNRIKFTVILRNGTERLSCLKQLTIKNIYSSVGLRRKIARFTEPETGAENFSKKGSRDGEKNSCGNGNGKINGDLEYNGDINGELRRIGDINGDNNRGRMLERRKIPEKVTEKCTEHSDLRIRRIRTEWRPQLSLFCKLWSRAQFPLFSSVYLCSLFWSSVSVSAPFGSSVPVSSLFGSSVPVSAPFGFSVKDSVKSGGSVHLPFSVAVSRIFFRSSLRLRLLSPFISPFRTVSFRKFNRFVYVPPFNLPLIFFGVFRNKLFRSTKSYIVEAYRKSVSYGSIINNYFSGSTKLIKKYNQNVNEF
ncbi:hypothetical protein BpHYR1_000131 [Brachionus plicatilis]|uniref:Uncharacterized protein n=1 Tax=Brachionus plicatilis TaxID=10195 RepID=A0A3M7SCU9_BRAPC|nr:hypothetical protein BpHYR1_000131 [Brachionus plicatilis]